MRSWKSAKEEMGGQSLRQGQGTGQPMPGSLPGAMAQTHIVRWENLVGTLLCWETCLMGIKN